MVKFITITSNECGQRLDNFLIKTLKSVPKSHIYQLIRTGRIRINKGRKKVNYRLDTNDILRLPPIRLKTKTKIYISASLTNAIYNNIIYEDDGLLVINKPYNLAVHSGSGIRTGLIETIKSTFNNNYELVHRLDRATSGILLISKKRSVLKNLHQQIANNKVEKFYEAVVVHSWAKKNHKIELPLTIKNNKTVVDVNGKNAVSTFRPLTNFTIDDICLSLVNIKIDTGRNHQIRVHSSHINHPVLGDNKYGDFTINNKLKTTRMYLHSSRIIFTNPLTTKKQTINCANNFDILL